MSGFESTFGLGILLLGVFFLVVLYIQVVISGPIVQVVLDIVHSHRHFRRFQSSVMK